MFILINFLSWFQWVEDIKVSNNRFSNVLFSFRCVSRVSSSLAENICKFRAEHGSFSSTQELINVYRIGQTSSDIICHALRNGGHDLKKKPITITRNKTDVLSYFSPKPTKEFLNVRSLQINSISMCSKNYFFLLNFEFHVQ